MYCLLFDLIFLCSFPLPEKFFDDNLFLFAADPFLLLLCVLASPMKEYSKLLTKVPLFMLIAAMIDKVDSRYANKVRIFSFHAAIESMIILCGYKPFLPGNGYPAVIY